MLGREPWLHSSIARRPWRPAERRVVWRGFWGRLAIAVEPLTIALFFIALSAGLLMRHQEGAILIAPIFGVASVLFLAYAFVLMLSVTRALIETFGSIWVVDGYVRYRARENKYGELSYVVAVLDEERKVLGEWPLSKRPPALDRADPWPALVEFTPYGGIHRIDGRSTGVLPDADDMPSFGIGAPQVFGRPPAHPRSQRLARRLR
jgi:hypothetical protein